MVPFNVISHRSSKCRHTLRPLRERTKSSQAFGFETNIHVSILHKGKGGPQSKNKILHSKEWSVSSDSGVQYNLRKLFIKHIQQTAVLRKEKQRHSAPSRAKGYMDSHCICLPIKVPVELCNKYTHFICYIVIFLLNLVIPTFFLRGKKQSFILFFKSPVLKQCLTHTVYKLNKKYEKRVL